MGRFKSLKVVIGRTINLCIHLGSQETKQSVHKPLRFYNLKIIIFPVFILGQDQGYTVKYKPLPSGTPEGKQLYLTVYSKSSPNKDIISF